MCFRLADYGVGIADEWNGHAQDENHWRDTHYRIEGPVVAQMQAAFVDNWTKVSGRVLNGEDYFPALKPVGEYFGQMFRSSVDGGAESMHLMYLLSIAAASKSIDLSMAYFVPDEPLVAADDGAVVASGDPAEVERMLAAARSTLERDKVWMQTARQDIASADARLDKAFRQLLGQ